MEGLEGSEQARTVGWKLVDGEITIVDQHGLWDEGALSDRDWQLLLTGAQTVTKQPGDRFIEQGKPNTHLYRIKRGQIRVEKVPEKGPRKVLVTLGQGTVLGDTAVIPSMKAATADVLADTECEMESISISILFGLFRSDPGLSMRFYRQMARKLAMQLRSLQMPKKLTAEEEAAIPDSDEEEAAAAAQAKKEERKEERKDQLVRVDSALLALHLKFQLPNTEVLVARTECQMKGVLKKVGRLYLFQHCLCFESDVFGAAQADKFPLDQVQGLELDKKTLKFAFGGKKHTYMNLRETDKFGSALLPIWQSLGGATQAVVDKKDKKEEKKKESKKDDKKGKDARSAASTPSDPSAAVTMGPEDWSLLLEVPLPRFPRSAHPSPLGRQAGWFR